MSSLLDVFVDVGARGLPQTEQDLQDFINRVSAAFGGLNKAAAVSVTSAGTAAGKKAAAAIVSDMRQAVLAFEQEKFEFDFQVRLLGDAAIRRQLSDLQSEVNAAKRQFALATDDAGQKTAKERVDLARQELRLLEQQAEAARISQGLAVPSVAAGDRERVFAQIKNDAAALNAELAKTSKLVSQASDPKLRMTFGQTADEAKKITQELNVAIRNKDFFNAESSLQQLLRLRQGIDSLRTEAERRISIRILSSNAQDQFDEIIRQAQVLRAETQIRLRLVGSDDLNRAFAETNQLLEIQKIKYKQADEANDPAGRIAAQNEINRLLQQEYKAISDSAEALAKSRGISGVKDVADQFRREADAVEEFNLRLKQTGRIAAEAKAPNISTDFKTLLSQAEALNLKLKQALDVGDLDLYKQLSAQLLAVDSQLEEIRNKSQSQIRLNLDLERAKDSFDELIARAAILRNQAKIQLDVVGDADLNQRLTDTNRLLEIQKISFANAAASGDLQGQIDARRKLNALLAEYAQIEKEAISTAESRGLTGGESRASQFRAATEQVAAFNLELKQSSQIVSRSGTPKLNNELQELRQQAERFNLELRQALNVGDLKSYSEVSAQLLQLRSKILEIRSAAESQINLKIQIPDLKNEFKAVTIALNQALQSGSIGSLKVLDASDRQEAIAYRSEITALIAEFNRLGSQAEVTADDILEMQKIIQQLSLTNPAAGPVRGLLDLEAKTGKVSRSFNSLNNDAYQFGQLVEDAAIGFELNGIAGAIRGAGNNASFLLQNFIASAVAAKVMSFRAGLLLTTLSAVGVAAAMIIIPRMIEWLSSLDDIEIKVRDIAEMLKREFYDARLQVSLELDQEAEARTLREVEDAIEGIQALIDRAQDRDDLQLKISAVLDNQSVQTLFRQATDATQQIADAARSQIASIEAQAQTIANRAAARGGRFQDFRQFLTPDQQDQIKEFEDLATAAGEFNDLRERIFEDSKRGVVDPVALETARDSLQSVIDGLELLKGKVSQEDAKILEANIAAARNEMERLNEDAQKLQAILDSDAQAMEALKDSAKEVSDELQFMAEVLQGNFGTEETVLFDIEKQKRQFAEAAQELIDLKGATDEVINTLEALAQKTQVEIVIKGETELKKLNDDLVDLSVKIKDINEEIAEAAIEAAKKQQDAQAKAAEKIADLQARLQDIATKKAFDGRRAAIQAEIDLLRSQLDEFQPDQFEAGALGTAIGGVGSNQIESQISALEMQLKNLEFAQRQAEEAKQIADINKQIAETQNKLAEELKKIEEERKKAEEELTIEMRGLGEMMMKLEEQEARLEEAIRNFDPTIPLQQGLPAGPAEAAEAAVMGSQWIQGIFDQLMQNTPQMPPQAAAGPLFRPEEPQFAPEDMPQNAGIQLPPGIQRENPQITPSEWSKIGDLSSIPDADEMRRAQSQAMDAALSSADFKSSSLEGLIDQSNRLLSTLGDAVNRLDVTSRYA